MLFIKYLLTAVLFVSPVIAAIDARQIVSNNKAIARELSRAKGTMEKYDGGLISNLMIAKALHDAKTSFGTARKDLAGPDNYTDEESSDIMESYKDLYPQAMDLLDVAHDKVRSNCTLSPPSMLIIQINLGARVQEGWRPVCCTGDVRPFA